MPDEDAAEEVASTTSIAEAEATETAAAEESDKDEDEAVVEDVPTDDEKKTEEVPPKMKSIVVDEWVQLNAQPPLWTRYVLLKKDYNYLSLNKIKGILRMSQMVTAIICAE